MDSSLWGCLLMLGYLGFDGFTSTWQDKMFKGYSMSIYNQILFVQLCSACVSLTSLVAFGQVCPLAPPKVFDPRCSYRVVKHTATTMPGASVNSCTFSLSPAQPAWRV